MARNVTFQHLRGVEASIPSLSVGELYFATDTTNLWVGTATGNVQIGGPIVLPQFAPSDPGFYPA